MRDWKSTEQHISLVVTSSIVLTPPVVVLLMSWIISVVDKIACLLRRSTVIFRQRVYLIRPDSVWIRV